MLDTCLLGMAARLTVMKIKRTHGTKSRGNQRQAADILSALLWQ